MDLPTDVDELVAALLRDGWSEEAVKGSDVPIRRLRRDDGFGFEARRERKVWKGRLDRGDGWRALEHVVAGAGTSVRDRFDLSDVPGARTAALAYAGEPQRPYVRWEQVVPRCIEWLRNAPPTPARGSGDVLGALARRDFHQVCVALLDRRTYGLHLRPLPPVPAPARVSPLELLRWLRRREIHERVRWVSDHLLWESTGTDRPGAIGGESQHLWVAYLDDPGGSLDPRVAIHDHLSDDFVRGELLDAVPLSRYLFDCLVTPSDFHSAWLRPGTAAGLEAIWAEETMRSHMRVSANWLQLGQRFLLDDPALAMEELGERAELAGLYEWGTRAV